MDYKKRTIKNVNELPSWYDLEKYKSATSLDASSWYELLLQRFTHQFNFKDDGPEKYKSDILDSGKNPFYLALLQSREDPLSLLTNSLQVLLIGGGKLEALKSDKEGFSTSVSAISPLTIRQLYQNERKLEDSTRIRIRKWMDQIFDDYCDIELTDAFKSECEWATSFIDDPIFKVFEKHGKEKEPYDRGRNHDLVQIDLSVPDKIIIQQFADYLLHVRKIYPDIKTANKYKYPEYQKWVDYGVLPYIDLNLWAEENGCSVPNRVMADAIYSDGEKGEETVRKTTQNIANMLMKREYVDFLATVAAHEIAEKKIREKVPEKNKPIL